jgi:hypothetical protein
MLGNRSNLSATCVSITTAKQAAPNICKSREPFTLSNLRFIWYAFPIDDARPRTQARQRLGNQREAVREVIAGAAVEPHAVAILACDNPEAIVLDFVQPQVAGGQLVGLCGKARRDEPGGEGTLQHVG